MSYKEGDKFIIEIDEEYTSNSIWHDSKLYKFKNFDGVIINEYTLSKLEKYDESSYKNDMDRMYQQGLKDAWETAMKIVLEKGNGGLSLKELEEIFKTCSILGIFVNHSAAEAIHKIKDYEEQLKAQEEHVMTLDEAIEHAEEKSGCDACGMEHKQLAEWLKELKAIRDIIKE